MLREERKIHHYCAWKRKEETPEYSLSVVSCMIYTFRNILACLYRDDQALSTGGKCPPCAEGS